MNLDNTTKLAQSLLDTINETTDRDFLDIENANRSHLIWMCNEIIKNQNKWNERKLHRWVGYIQGVLVVNQITTVDVQRELVTLVMTGNA